MTVFDRNVPGIGNGNGRDERNAAQAVRQTHDSSREAIASRRSYGISRVERLLLSSLGEVLINSIRSCKGEMFAIDARR